MTKGPGGKPKAKGAAKRELGCVSEWFGHRVHPSVSHDTSAMADQEAKRCPFLSAAKHADTPCVKPDASNGICTISAASNGPRQDWLVCPFRAFQPAIIESAMCRIFGIDEREPKVVIPVTTLASEDVRRGFQDALKKGTKGFLYLSGKLGGEISISPTPRSPELSFDVTLVEVARSGSSFGPKRYGILEVQTMDFHGSYRAVVKNLEDALRLHKAKFHKEVEANPEWLSQSIEGPNIANVFKRTFYQMMLKFQIAGRGSCAGCVLAIPVSVWDSWQRHLGRPDLKPIGGNLYSLHRKEARAVNAWIYVFDIDASAKGTPSPIALKKVIATDAESIAYFALNVAPEAALATGGSADRVLATVAARIAALWPGFSLLP